MRKRRDTNKVYAAQRDLYYMASWLDDNHRERLEAVAEAMDWSVAARKLKIGVPFLKSRVKDHMAEAYWRMRACVSGGESDTHLMTARYFGITRIIENRERLKLEREASLNTIRYYQRESLEAQQKHWLRFGNPEYFQ